MELAIRTEHLTKIYGGRVIAVNDMSLEVPQPYWRAINMDQMFLDAAYCDITGIFGSTELDEHLVHLEYYDKNDKANVSKSYSWDVGGVPLDEAKGGTLVIRGVVIIVERDGACPPFDQLELELKRLEAVCDSARCD